MTDLQLIHASATLAMTGLIWFVQVVHYPLFRFAAIGNFAEFAASHQRRTTWIVLPLMSAELVTAVLIFAGAPTALAIIGLGLLAAIWLSTVLVQVPLHQRLCRGFDSRVAGALARTNWLRTIGWSLRSVIALQMLAS